MMRRCTAALGTSTCSGMTVPFFLYKSGSGHWVAVSAPANGDDPILDGQPVFRTIDELVDPTVAGTYRWQQWDPVSSTWQWDMRFETTELP